MDHIHWIGKRAQQLECLSPLTIARMARNRAARFAFGRERRGRDRKQE
jgi:hypothetical protein